MKIFITGCDGFVGSHVAEHLSKAGHEVTAGCYGAPEFLTDNAGLAVRRFDLRAPESIRPCLEGVEGIVNCAAIFDLSATAEQLNSLMCWAQQTC